MLTFVFLNCILIFENYLWKVTQKTRLMGGETQGGNRDEIF